MAHFSSGAYSISFWMRSTCVKTIRLQQYLFKPSASSACRSEYSASRNFMYCSHLFPITFPQEKHRTGIIILQPFCRTA
eukprot:m.437520 g.437520  ORF g.437520 m.437520 type:complete len:79 (+) comp18120_c0_seq1:253-489(+)